MRITKSLALASLVLLVGVAVLSTQSGYAAQRRAIIVYHNDWGSAVPAMKAELESRAYSVTQTDNATSGLLALTEVSKFLKSGDYLVVYLAGHGSNPRWFSDTSKATALQHFVQFNSGILKVSQTAPLFEQIANKGVNLTVIDGSCNGGETVLYAMGQKYCALSTTGVFSPGLTNFPSPSNAIDKDSNPGKFGSWWGYPHMTASWMNGEIVGGVPERINQRLFRNDDTDIANLSIFLRPSIGFLTALDLGGWNLHYQYCYLYRFIYPDEYAVLDQAEKAKFTNSVQTYLGTMHSIVDPQAPNYTKLNAYLDDSSLLKQAAAVYAGQYTNVWRTLANDSTWNLTAEPGKYAAKMKGITPDVYKGEAGFLQIAGEIEFLMSILQTGFQQQDALLQQIDAKARELHPPHQLPDASKRFVKPVWPPPSGAPLLKFNQHERRLIKRFSDTAIQERIDYPSLLKLRSRSSAARPMRLAPQARTTEAREVLSVAAAAGRKSSKTVIRDRVGLSASAAEAMKRQKLEELVGEFKAISPSLSYAEGRISFLLAILEDAVGKVQGSETSPSTQVSF